MEYGVRMLTRPLLYLPLASDRDLESLHKDLFFFFAFFLLIM